MTKYIQSKDVAWNFLGENIIAFTLSGEKEFHHLNPTAAVVFKSLETPKSNDELVATVIEEFEVSYETASTDVQSMIAEMSNKQLILEA